MSHDKTQPEISGADGSDAGAKVPPGAPRRETNGTPVDLGSHNPDPHAHEWLHPEADLATWDSAFDTAESVAGSHVDDGGVEPDDGGDAPDGGPDDGDAPDQHQAPDEHQAPLLPGAVLPAPLPARAENTTRQRLVIGAIVVVVMAAMGVGIWLLVNMLSSGSEQAAGGQPSPDQSSSAQPLPRNVNALEFQQGDCFADFDSEANSAMAVACNTGHSAQLVAVHRYPSEESYPGRDTLKAKAQDVCKGAQLTPKSNEYALKFQLVYPSPTSWDKGDRRVDCFIVVDNGNTIMENLVK